MTTLRFSPVGHDVSLRLLGSTQTVGDSDGTYGTSYTAAYQGSPQTSTTGTYAANYSSSY